MIASVSGLSVSMSDFGAPLTSASTVHNVPPVGHAVWYDSQVAAPCCSLSSTACTGARAAAAADGSVSRTWLFCGRQPVSAVNRTCPGDVTPPRIDTKLPASALSTLDLLSSARY